jgi:hypothetical protein
MKEKNPKQKRGKMRKVMGKKNWKNEMKKGKVKNNGNK